MKQEKKVNSYLRAIKIIALACVIGGVIGGVTGAIRFVLLSRGVAVSGDWVLQQIRSQLVPILGIIFAVTVILEELCFHKLKGICEKQITAEDEECDQLEYEEERTGAFGTNLNVLSQVVSIFFLTFGYSMKYIEADVYVPEEVPQETEDIAQAEPKPDLIEGGTIYNLEELSDFDFLLSHFYTVESNTSISAAELNVEKLLDKDMTIDCDVDGPQILIYHTHSQEGFVDSVPGDNSTTIMGAGEYLSELLREKGFEVMHVTSVYDLVDGELDRNEAYSRAEKEISQILEEYPSIQAVIDLHRDGVNENTHLVTEINGKPMARFMFFNGLSRTKKNGPIDYLYNPYIEDNLALTLQLKLLCDQYYPGLSRNIYLKSLRYNLHLSDKALLIEVGAQTNTLQEILNTMEPLSVLLAKVFGV